MSGRAAIVTGAASGIGRAIALDLAARGTRVLFADVNVEEGARVVAGSPTGAFQRADIAKQADCEALVARAVREFGGIDILVNNAGLQHVAPVEEFPVERGSGSSTSCCSAPST
jgi:3-hydroxybutyrate dehydrogenase